MVFGRSTMGVFRGTIRTLTRHNHEEDYNHRDELTRIHCSLPFLMYLFHETRGNQVKPLRPTTSTGAPRPIPPAVADHERR